MEISPVSTAAAPVRSATSLAIAPVSGAAGSFSIFRSVALTSEVSRSRTSGERARSIRSASVTEPATVESRVRFSKYATPSGEQRRDWPDAGHPEAHAAGRPRGEAGERDPAAGERPAPGEEGLEPARRRGRRASGGPGGEARPLAPAP